MTLAVFGLMRVAPENVKTLLPAIKALAEGTRKNDGCIAYDVAEDLFEPGLIRFSELWADRESLERHLQAPHIEPWTVAAKASGLQESHFMAYGISGSWPV